MVTSLQSLSAGFPRAQPGKRPARRLLHAAILLAGYARPAGGAALATEDALAGWEVVWMAPFLSGGGYSSEAISFVLELARLVPQLRIAQFAEPQSDAFVDGLSDAQYAALASIAQRPTAAGARTLAICHSTPDVWVPSRYPGWDETAPCPPPHAEIAVGRTMYESDRLPADWAARCSRMDETWVPTEFHRESFARSGVERAKLHVVGEPVDVELFDPARTTPLDLRAATGRGPLASASGKGAAGGGGEGRGGRPFVFLSVFKWEARKGWDVLLAAFLREFHADEGVELVLKTSRFHSDASIQQRVASFTRELGLAEGSAAPVHVLELELALSELPRLYRAVDAFVLPSRGEGWGRPHAEAMAMGLPAIATKWSGPTAFMDERNSFPVRVAALVPVQTDDAALRAEGHLWAQPDEAHLRAQMRFVYEHPELAAVRGRAARADMVARFSPRVVGEAVRERLRQLAAAAGAAAPASWASRDEL
ncbi:hypothetical protein T492DRAFT_1065749 [Pavlovales sp. CCMP2436]|nr:hypothetical protein T492DRAFT_1065749 [Pavlovales sp. CCMP2436]